MGIATYSYNRSTSGGEIIRELVNATDGQGLHFANGAALLLAYASGGVFGTADFSIEFILDQDADNSSDNEIYTSQIAGSNVLKVTNSISSNVVRISFDSTNYDIAYDMSGDYGTPTHYVLTCDRSALATLYKNGNSVGTIDISGSSAVNLGNGNTANGYLGGVSGYGAIGSYYRWRTWKKLLSSAEVTACYENASVPIADQWSNCVTDLDLAFANPERSLAVRSKSGVGNATASAGVFQLNPIEQLNSKSARIGTSAATPADNELMVGGAIKVQNDTASLRVQSDTTPTKGAALSYDHAGSFGQLLVDEQGVNQLAMKYYALSHTFGRSDGLQYVTIDSAGQVGLSATPNLSSSYASNTILTLKGKATAYGGIIELSNHGTSGNGQTLGAIRYFDPTTSTTKNAEIEVLRESADDDAKMVFKTKPTGGTLADRLTIDSAGNVGVGVAPAVNLHVASTAVPTFRIHHDSTSSPAAIIQLMRGTTDTFGGDAYTDWQFHNEGGSLKFQYNDTGVGSLQTPLSISYAGLSHFATNVAGDTEVIRVENLSSGRNAWTSFYRSATENGRLGTAGDHLTLEAQNGKSVRVFDDGGNGMSIADGGLATFSGNTEHGGADGVQTFYAHGIAAGNTTWYVDVPCDSDAGIATVFKVEASFSHCNCGFSAILETWTATRATSATSYEVKREDSSDAGVWSVSKTSNTNFRVTHTAGSSSGTGPYWVKVTHRNA